MGYPHIGGLPTAARVMPDAPGSYAAKLEVATARRAFQVGTPQADRVLHTQTSNQREHFIPMKRAIATVTIAALLSIATPPPSAHADDTQPDSWGNAPDARSPHPDSKERSGHWWWPESSSASDDDQMDAGNRGQVFGTWSDTQLVVAPDFPMPQITPPLISCGSNIVLNNILFPLDSIQLSDISKAEINKAVAEMQKFNGDTVTCVGHTDDTGSETYNQQLGLRRAQAVVDYIAANGIAPQRLRAESKGENEPAVPNDTPANRALNRRVTFQYKMGN